MKRPIILKGKRVALGPLMKDDLDRCWRWINDKQVTQYLVGFFRVYTREMEEDWIDRALRAKEDLLFAILLLPDLQHIGNVGLHKINWVNRNAELGIIIGEKEYWNQGLGTEATILALDYAFNIMGLKSVYLRVMEYNKRAIRCYEKVGFKHVGRLRSHIFRGGRWWDVLIMDILNEEFNEKHPSAVKAMNLDIFESA